jgi:hypothetical protein
LNRIYSATIRREESVDVLSIIRGANPIRFVNQFIVKDGGSSVTARLRTLTGCQVCLISAHEDVEESSPVHLLRLVISSAECREGLKEDGA